MRVMGRGIAWCRSRNEAESIAGPRGPSYDTACGSQREETLRRVHRWGWPCLGGGLDGTSAHLEMPLMTPALPVTDLRPFCRRHSNQGAALSEINPIPRNMGLGAHGAFCLWLFCV